MEWGEAKMKCLRYLVAFVLFVSGAGIALANSGHDVLSDAAARRLAQMEHPYLLQSAEGWEEVKYKIDNYDWAAEIADGLIDLADKFSVPGLRGRGDYAGTENYVFHRRYVCRKGLIKTAAFAYTLTKEEKYAKKLATFLLRLSDSERGYPYTEKGASHGPVKEGLLFQKAAVAYDAIHNSSVLTQKKHAQIQNTFRLFLEKAADKYTRNSMGNHTVSHITGAVMVSMVLKDFNYLKRFIDGPGGIVDQIVNGVLDDGWYFETDTGYHMLVAEWFARVAFVLKPLGVDLFEYQIPLDQRVEKAEAGRGRAGESYRDYRSIRDMFDSMIRMSNYQAVVFANNKSGETKIGGAAFELAYYLSRESAYAWAINQHERQGHSSGNEESSAGGRGMYSLLYGIPELPTVPDLRQNTATAHNAGLYVLRSPGRKGREEIQAVLKSGFKLGGREHQDDASLLSLMRYGRSFYNPRVGNVDRRIWKRRSASHNMVIVNQGNQSGQNGAENLLHHNGELFTAAAAETHVTWDGLPVRQRRLIIVTDDYVIIGDHVKVLEGRNEDHEFDWLIHPVGFKELNGKKKVLEKTDRLGGKIRITNTKWYQYHIPACARFDQRFEDGTLQMDVHVLKPRHGTMVIGDYPDETRQGQQRKTLSIRSTGSSAKYLTVIEPHEGKAIIKKTGALANEETMKIKLTDGRVHIVEIKGFDSEDDAPSMAVRLTELKQDKVLQIETADKTFPESIK